MERAAITAGPAPEAENKLVVDETQRVIDTLNAINGDPQLREKIAADPTASQLVTETAGNLNGAPEKGPGNAVALRGSSVAVRNQPGTAVAVRGSSAVAVPNQPGSAVALLDRPSNEVALQGEIVDTGVAERNAADLARRNGQPVELPVLDGEIVDKKKPNGTDPDILSDDKHQGKGEIPVQYDKDGNPIYTNVDLSKVKKSGNQANNETADNGGDKGGETPSALEILKSHGIDVDKWAKAKKNLEDKVGLLKILNRRSKQEANLTAAEKEVAKQVADLDIPANEKIALWGVAIKGVTQRQAEMGEKKRFYHNSKVALALSIGAGIALSVLNPIDTLIAKGAVGGALGGAFSARLARSAANTKERVEVRVANQLNNSKLNLSQVNNEDYSAYSSRTGEELRGLSMEHRKKNEANRRKRVLVGAALGAAVGGLLSLGGDAGPVDAPAKESVVDVPKPEGAGTTDLPVPSKDVIAQMVIDDPSKIGTVPGLENITIDSVTPQEAAAQYDGNYVWDSLEHGSGITSDQETYKAIINGWSELHNVPGVEIDTSGSVHFDPTSGTYETTGPQWSAEMTVDHLNVVDANGDVHQFDGTLTNSQQAELLDLGRQDGVQYLSGDEALKDYLTQNITATPEQMTQMVNDTVDQVVKEVNTEWAAQRAEVGALAPEDLLELKQGIIQQNIAQHASLITSLPEAYRDTLIAQIAQANSISEAAIREMLTKSLTLAA